MKITIYMKSGNVIHQKAVSKIQWKLNGEDEFSYLKIESRWWSRFFTTIAVQTVTLKQIECVTVSRFLGVW